MKKILFFMIFTVAFTVSANAEFYVSGKVGYTHINTSVDGGWLNLDIADTDAFSGYFAGGYAHAFSDKIGGRAELQYGISGAISGDFEDAIRHNFTVNVYGDLFTGTMFTPFVGVGLGGSVIDPGDVFSDIQSGFHIGATIGVGISVLENLSIDLGYKLSGDFTSQDIINFTHTIHDLYVGVRYKFK